MNGIDTLANQGVNATHSLPVFLDNLNLTLDTTLPVVALLTYV
jgi:hypothetical protein